MKLTVIGCSGSMPGPTSPASSYLVSAGDTRVLLDLGSGAFGPLQRHTNPGALDAVVLSHLHPDHCADLTALEVWLRYGPGGVRPRMRVLGPVGLHERILELTHMDTATLEATFAVEILQPGSVTEIGGVRLHAHQAWHPVPALSYRLTAASEVRDGDASLCYTGDTDLCEGVADAARGVDLLLAEAAFTQAEPVRGVHLTGVRAGQLATSSGAGSLVLTHVQPWADSAVVLTEARSEYGGNVTLATPGADFVL